MGSVAREIKRKLIIKYFFVTEFVTICFVVFLTSSNFATGYGHRATFELNFLFSQWLCITVYGFVLVALRFSEKDNRSLRLLLFTIIILTGAILGTLLGAAFDFDRRDKDFLWIIIHPELFFQLVFLGISLGTIIGLSFHREEKILIAKAHLQEEELKRLANEKKIMETNLRILLSQIEPHFLFNTLTSAIGLLDSDLKRGKTMLLNLTHYLRISLAKSRRSNNSITKEIEMIEAYLQIFALRMGDRLQYTIDIQEGIDHLLIPTMLIQPLVENAIKHGLEPAIKGGAINIRIRTNENYVRIEVADTGPGFHKNSKLGVGLSNVKERIDILYSGAGRFVLDENQPSGLKAIIEIPYDQNNGDSGR